MISLNAAVVYILGDFDLNIALGGDVPRSGQATAYHFVFPSGTSPGVDQRESPAH